MKSLFKKTSLIFLLSVLLWSGVGFGLKNNKINLHIGKCALAQNTFGATPIRTNGATPGATQGAGITNQEQMAVASGAKSWWDSILDGPVSAITGSVGKIVMMVNGVLLQAIAIPLMSMLFRISAAMLRMSTEFTLSSDLFNNIGIATGITVVWSTIRNICNITFIFILLWAAIQMIIGLAGGNTKKMIASVIIAALLINFSLFITRIIVDAGNILGVTIYNQIRAIDPNLGLDSLLMKNMGLDGISTLTTATGGSITGLFTVAFGMISYLQLIVLLVAFIVFVYAMLLMAARSVLLIFLMVMSPIGFMGSVLPKLAEYSKSWRETLYGQTMIAPVFLLFVLLILKVSSAFDNIPIGAVTPDSIEITKYLPYFRYIMTILLLIVAVKVTKKMTGPIGQAVEGFGKFIAGAAVGLASGGVALAGRQLIGRGATNRLSGEYGKDLRAKADAGDWKARAELATLERASKSTFDVRNVKSVGKAAGFLGDKMGVKIDAGKAGGVYSKDGKQTGFAGGLKAEQEKANKAYEDAEKAVSNQDKIAASGAMYRRDKEVERRLKTAGSAHNIAETEIKRLKQDGISTHTDMVAVETNLRSEKLSLAAAHRSGDQMAIKDAEKSYATAEKARDDKKKELENENMQKYAKEISDQQKIIEKERKVAVSAVEGDSTIISPAEKAQINRVERARNLANSYRRGQMGRGLLNSGDRNEQVASGMENHKRKSEEEQLLEELREARKELREQATKNKTT